MRKVKVEELTVEKFAPFGSYANLINPDTEKLGAPPIEFFRDMALQDCGNCGLPAFSTCRVEKRPFIIDISEYHNHTGEATLPLDNDILIHVGPATPADDIPVDKFKVFRIPKGTVAILRPGVWHHAPFTVDENPANVLIVLPERTYANDCIACPLEEKDQIEIEM